MTQCCAECGRPLLDTSRFGLALERGYAKILDVLIEAGDGGIRADYLFDAVYDAGDGGPLSGPVALRTRIYYLNQKLALKKKKIISKGAKPRYRGCYGRYYLVDTQ